MDQLVQLVLAMPDVAAMPEPMRSKGLGEDAIRKAIGARFEADKAAGKL